MESYLFTQSIDSLNKEQSLCQLESGKILFFPQYHCGKLDSCLLTEAILHESHKNISYDYKQNRLGQYNKNITHLDKKLVPLMRGYADFALQLIHKALPTYLPHIQWGRTSYRPAEIAGRATSKRKDDTRLHVDSFPATPVNGLRILRIFCNLNPYNVARNWYVGEPFTAVLPRFAPKIKPYNKVGARMLHCLKVTKTLRSAYDHYMLHLHDEMKKSDSYQKDVKKSAIDFPSYSTWMVFTDYVSHAALGGQFLLEQTFYLPVDKMQSPEWSPWYEWQKWVDL